METITFKNEIAYMVVSPIGTIESQGTLSNAVGALSKDQILKAVTTPYLTAVGTLIQLNYLGFRTDGSTVMGSFAQWYTAGSAFSTRYNNSSQLTSVGYNGTYIATANVTVRAIALLPAALSGLVNAATTCGFYSTNINMAVGSAGAIIVQWTVSMP